MKNLIYKTFPSFGATPSTLQTEHMNLEKKAFFHFGINTFTNNEWGDGTERLAAFTPASLDVRQWIHGIKDAGFKLAIITAKHHDGFCLWPSKYTEHSIKNTPYKNGNGDIIKEFTDACREFGIKIGIYISPWDRNSPLWGKDEYSVYYAKQLEEIVTGYGRIDEIWWDGAGSAETRYDWKSWHDIIKKHQPTALIFGSMGATDYVSLRWVGNERGYANERHYASINPESLITEITAELNTGKLGGKRYIPAEVDVSIRPGWFYHEDQDSKIKSPSALDDIWFNSVGRNAMMLLNFPPDRRGLVNEEDLRRAIESNARIEKMRERNYLSDARVSADSVYSDDFAPENIINGDAMSIYAPKTKNAVIDIELKAPVSVNVFTLSEFFELGERITDFTLTDKETGDIILHSSSVGRLKAVRFPERLLKSIRLSVNAAEIPLIRNVALYKYDAPADENCVSFANDLLESKSAKVEISDARKTAILNFGGIYEFNTVTFKTENPTSYNLYTFDGQNFQLECKGETESNLARIMLTHPRSCYQIKIEVLTPFTSDPSLSVGFN